MDRGSQYLHDIACKAAPTLAHLVTASDRQLASTSENKVTGECSRGSSCGRVSSAALQRRPRSGRVITVRNGARHETKPRALRTMHTNGIAMLMRGRAIPGRGNAGCDQLHVIYAICQRHKQAPVGAKLTIARNTLRMLPLSDGEVARGSATVRVLLHNRA